MTTESPAPPTPGCAAAPFCEDGYRPPDPSTLTEPFASGTAADLAGPPLSPELVQGIQESVAQAVPADLNAMLGTTDPTPVIVGALVALAVIFAAATVLVRRHRAAVTEGDVLRREAVEQVSVTDGDVS